jgi:hypothetical protein
MVTSKQAAITAISQLPETASIADIIVVLRQMKTEQQSQNQLVTQTQPISCFDLMKDYLGCAAGPEDLSTDKTYMKGYGL